MKQKWPKILSLVCVLAFILGIAAPALAIGGATFADQQITTPWDETRGHRYAYGADGRQLLGVAGEEPGVTPDGDLYANGNLYYFNPDRDPAKPDTCYLMTNYKRTLPDQKGVAYYDRDGITFVGWMHDENGGMRYQTSIGDLASGGYAIFVWRAQPLPECQHPDHPGDAAYNIPAGWYIFDDNGILITADGEYDSEYYGDGKVHRYTIKGGKVTAMDGQSVAEEEPVGVSYVLNTNTKKFHRPTCSSVGRIKAEHRIDYKGTRDKAIRQGYVPCKICEP